MMAALVKCGKVGVLQVRCGYKLFLSATRQYYEKPVPVVQRLIKAGLTQQDNVELYPLHLDSCSFNQSFSKAGVFFNTYSLDENGNYQNAEYGGKTVTPVLDFRDVFEKGYSMLRTFVSEDTCDSRHDEEYDVERWKALYRLCEFLLDKGYHETALKNKEATECPEELLERTETFSAALLTSHLLTKLMPGENYVISSNYCDKPLLCPCHDNCGMLMKYGSTGLGLERLWYGHRDIVLSSCNSNVMIFNAKSEELLKSQEGTTFDEKEKSEDVEDKLNLPDCDPQIISQTITFSLYQSGKSHLSLVPTIVLTPSNFCVYFYDHVHDVLLRMGSPYSLWEADDECKFSMSAILKLWMVINYSSFKPVLSDNQISRLQCSANFHNLLAKEGLSIKEVSKRIKCKSKFKSDCHFDLTKRKNDVVDLIM